MTDKHPKRPRDPAQLAKLMIDIATGEAKENAPKKGSDRYVKGPRVSQKVTKVKTNPPSGSASAKKV